jgi:hypothetical protein
MLQSIVTPALEHKLLAAKPSDVIASSYITMLQVRFFALDRGDSFFACLVLTRSRVVVVGDIVMHA